MADEQKQQIIEYIFGSKDVPAHIMDEFSSWLLEHENDPEIEALMFEKWENYSSSLFKEGDLQGLKGIKKTIAWFFEHEDWMKNVTSGDYQKYYQEMYK